MGAQGNSTARFVLRGAKCAACVNIAGPLRFTADVAFEHRETQVNVIAHLGQIKSL